MFRRFSQAQEPTPPPSGLEADAIHADGGSARSVPRTETRAHSSDAYIIPAHDVTASREPRVRSNTTASSKARVKRHKSSMVPLSEIDAFTDLSLSPSQQQHGSSPTPPPQSFSQTRVPREAPYREEAYNSALTDLRRRSRFSSNKRRANGVEEEDYERAVEASRANATQISPATSWPPRRKKRKTETSMNKADATKDKLADTENAPVAAIASILSYVKGKARELGEPEQERIRDRIINGMQPCPFITSIFLSHLS
jgi:hypothetical protein